MGYVFWPNFSPNVLNLLFLVFFFFTLSCLSWGYLKKVVFLWGKCSDCRSVSDLGLNTVAKQADPLCRINLHYNIIDFLSSALKEKRNVFTYVASYLRRWQFCWVWRRGRVREHSNRKENGAGTTRNVFISPLFCTRGFIAHLRSRVTKALATQAVPPVKSGHIGCDLSKCKTFVLWSWMLTVSFMYYFCNIVAIILVNDFVTMKSLL